jgi:hypothetical protein
VFNALFTTQLALLQASSDGATLFDDLHLWSEIHNTVSKKVCANEHLVAAQRAMLNKITGELKGGKGALFTNLKWDENVGAIEKLVK